MPDGQEALHARHHLGPAHRLGRRRGRDEFRRVHTLHALRPLQVQEMREGIGAERQQREVRTRREKLGVAREVRPRQRRRGPDRRHDVVDQREVQHLLDGDAGNGLLPSCDRIGLPGGQALIGLGLEAETRVQVWHMSMCSNCAASTSKLHSCSRCSTTSLVSAITAPGDLARCRRRVQVCSPGTRTG
jgi:hypothetical protein